ncbi:MAG TPA: 3'(2'),5'-bisphosphate nucleotidase CysQ [Longimicrobiales bacterium]|nr:3'(2'),5'-bisphosphate nucleotidase CysQ [Longimicrobiales bacterium]
MSTGRWAGEVEVAVAAAREAGVAAMAHYGNVSATRKAGGSPVTAADHAANDAILERLAREYPADAVLSEESSDSSARLGAARVWIVDPLDGTKEFLAQNGEFAIMIGLAVDGSAAAGALYLPARGALYRAAAGEGAWRWWGTGDGWSRLDPPPAGDRLRLVGSRSHADPFMKDLAERLGASDVIASGSVGVKCSLIASGERDLYVHPVSYLSEWDTCAPEILLREAGGTVLDCLGTPLRYNKEHPVQPHGILACGPGAERTIEVVTEMYQSRGARLDSSDVL